MHISVIENAAEEARGAEPSFQSSHVRSTLEGIKII